MPSPIRFFNDDVSYRIPNKKKIRDWLLATAKSENFSISELNIVLCSDNQILKINNEHLKHDYYTDIITFDYGIKSTISGEIFISIDRVKDNARTNSVATLEELNRVIIHGLLHLCGYNDKTSQDKMQMTQKENEYLSKRRFV